MVRVQELGIREPSTYADMGRIQRELSWAREIYRRHDGWRVVDVTRRAIEETASEVVRQYSENFGAPTI
jgi:regulator of PEP synthase PpsR (kinase-PPPase family)